MIITLTLSYHSDLTVSQVAYDLSINVINGDAQYVQNGQDNLDKPFNSTYITDENFYKIPVGRSNGAPSNTEVHYTYVRTMTVFTGDHKTPEYKGYNVIYRQQ